MQCLERFSFYQVLFFSCVRLISFLVVSAKTSDWKICRIKLHRRPRKEIRISAQVWFQAVNGLCLAEFKQWPSGQMGDKFSPIFRSLRLAARHVASSLCFRARLIAKPLIWKWFFPLFKTHFHMRKVLVLSLVSKREFLEFGIGLFWLFPFHRFFFYLLRARIGILSRTVTSWQG